MKNISHKAKIALLVITIIAIIISLLGIYKYQKIRIFDKTTYNELCKNLEKDAVNFNCQKDLKTYITTWAEDNNLKCIVDDFDNIIFEKQASKKKTNETPTVFVVNYNYDNAVKNRKVLSTAAMLAYTDVNSSKTTVIFINNENNDGQSYENINHSYFPDNAKVIYLDAGKSSYISASSYRQEDQTVTIDAKKVPVSCDTAIKIKIEGLKSDCIDTNVTTQTNPIILFSTLLTRLQTKSTICQLANLKVGNRGYMYPSSIEATILLNSYSVDSFTKYIDKRIEKFEKNHDIESEPNVKYSYEIIEKSSDAFPKKAYSKKTLKSLTTMLFTLDSDTYRFNEEDMIPDGYEEYSIYGISSVRQIRTDKSNIFIDITSQAINKSKLSEILNDHSEAAKLSDCSIKTTKKLESFKNNKPGLINTLQKTYFIVNDLSGTNITLKEKNDTYFTPMTYLARINKNMDIIHVKEGSKANTIITNMLLCYIETKGNFLSL